MKNYSKKGLEKRKEERKDFPEFFKKHIEIIWNGKLCCEECGDRLQGNSTEIAHILPKSTFKSISTEDKNVLYLCGLWSDNNCHYKYDNDSNDKVKQMKIFPKVIEIFEELKEVITEKINYKISDRYTK